MHVSIWLEGIYISYDDQNKGMHFYANYGTVCFINPRGQQKPHLGTHVYTMVWYVRG